MASESFKARFLYWDRDSPSVEEFVLDTDNISLLRKYTKYYDEMIQLGIDPSKMDINLNVQVNTIQRKTLVRTKKPHPLVLSGFANAMRPFVLQNELTYFYKILKAVRESCTSDSLRIFLRTLARGYKCRLSGVTLKLRAGQEQISQERAFSLWLNAYIYHRDPAKRELLESFESAAPLNLQEAFFQMLFIEKARVVQVLAIMVKHILAQDASVIMSVDPRSIRPSSGL
jgi:hypothetical protein